MKRTTKGRRSGRQWSAWAVHAYTATGAVWAFLAAQAAATGALRAAFLWLFVAIIVDSTDGLIARRVRVQERLPDFSGAKLDDIVDYLTFVFVPALIVWRADLVGAVWTVPVAVAMLLTSAYGFVSADAKTQDQFTGFPSYWNIVVLYLVILDPPHLYNIAILLFMSALVFVRIGYVYPTRTRSGRAVTLALSAVWSVMVLVLLIQLPHPSRPLAWISLFFPVYYTCLSLALHRRRGLLDSR
jgi:phosphatidylcholine synthase